MPTWQGAWRCPGWGYAAPRGERPARSSLAPNRTIISHPWGEPRTSAVTQIVIPIVDAVELSGQPLHPELEIERRAKLCERHAEEEAAKRKTRAEAEARRVAEEQRAAKERADFKADLWAKLDDLQHFALRLACAVEGKDKALAASLRAVVNQYSRIGCWRPGGLPAGGMGQGAGVAGTIA